MDADRRLPYYGLLSLAFALCATVAGVLWIGTYRYPGRGLMQSIYVMYIVPESIVVSICFAYYVRRRKPFPVSAAALGILAIALPLAARFWLHVEAELTTPASVLGGSLVLAMAVAGHVLARKTRIPDA
ncbi:MAG: hypothetical protein ACYTKD_01790 [Planctomycetota bacterium]|jgi:hypothetical protein